MATVDPSETKYLSTNEAALFEGVVAFLDQLGENLDSENHREHNDLLNLYFTLVKKNSDVGKQTQKNRKATEKVNSSISNWFQANQTAIRRVMQTEPAQVAKNPNPPDPSSPSQGSKSLS